MAQTIQEPKKVKIRKDHTCQGCGKKLNKSEEATVSKYAESGTVYSFYECDDCRKHFEDKCKQCKDYYDCMGENYYLGLITECKEQIL